MEHSPFGRLPLEIREQIYHDYWVSRCSCRGWITIGLQTREVYNSFRLAHKTWSIIEPSAPECRQCTPSRFALSLTCRQILEEASRIFWRGRTLFFVVETWKDAFRDRYSKTDRISTICYIQGLILKIAAKWRYAVAGLKNIEISIHGFARSDLPEVVNILQETQKLLSRWRAPGLLMIPVHLRLRETYGGRGMYIRNTRFGIFDDLTLRQHWLDIHFPLVMSIPTNCNIKLIENVYSEYWVHRQGSRWYPTFLRQVQWRMQVPPVESFSNDCGSPPGCRCLVHAGRSLMARDRDGSAWSALSTQKSRRHRLATMVFHRLAFLRT